MKIKTSNSKHDFVNREKEGTKLTVGNLGKVAMLTTGTFVMMFKREASPTNTTQKISLLGYDRTIALLIATRLKIETKSNYANQ